MTACSAGGCRCPTPRRCASTWARRWRPRSTCLAGAEDNDAGLYVYRLALLHEDRLCESLAVAAQALQLSVASGRNTLAAAAGPCAA